MNNLKRVLSLALSGIMLVGMMAMGASAADFTDADTIVHQDAVDILVGLGVINGQDDGSFNPKGNVTRAQMAKMIAVAMKGGNDVSTGTKGTASFTDIKGHWAESSIEYCYDLGIISGRGDGTFAPDDNVTGIEAAKMILTALGYAAEAYELTGASWATRTDELARTARPSLYDELDNNVTLNQPANRETAAQMIWNGLQNQTRKVTPSTNKNNGEVTWTYNDGATMLNERYDAYIFTGSLVGNKDTNNGGAEKGEIIVRGQREYFDNNGNALKGAMATVHFPSTTSIDFIGEEVRVIYKNGTRSSTNDPDKNDKIYGVYVTGATPVIRTTRDKLAGVKDTNRAVLKVDGTEYELHQTVDNNGNVTGNHVNTYYNYNLNVNVTGGKSYTDGVGTNNTSSFAKVLEHANGDAVKIILDDAGRIDTIYVTEAKLAVVTHVNGDKITINQGVGTIKKSENDIYDDVAKDDVVVVSTLYKPNATDDGAYSIVKKAEVVSGSLTAYKKVSNNTDCESITVDSTVYKIYHTNGTAATTVSAMVDPGISKAITTLDSTVLDVDVDVYMVNGFAAAAKKTGAANNNYSVVLEIRKASEANSAFTSFQLYVMDGQGTKTIITVNDEVEDKTKTASNADDLTKTANKVIDLSDIAAMKVKFNGQDGVDRWEGTSTTNKPETVFEVGDIITYSLDKNNKADVTIEARPVLGTGYTKATKQINGVVTDPDAVIFVLTKGGYAIDDGLAQTGAGKTIKAYKAAELGDVAANLGVSVATVSGKAVAGFIAYNNDDPAGATSNEVYGVVASDGSTTSAGTQYTISVNGETQIVTLKNNSTALQKGQVVRFEPTSDNVYANAGDFDLTTSKSFSAYVKEYDADRNIITFYTGNALVGVDLDANNNPTRYEVKGSSNNNAPAVSKTYAVSSDVKIYAVDVNDKTSSVGSAASVSSFNSNTGKRNVILVVSKDANNNWVVETIIAETSGQKDIDDKTTCPKPTDDNP